MPITLTHVIAANTTLEVRSAGLTTGAGGVALRFGLHDGPITFALSDSEGRWLIQQIQQIQTQLDIRRLR